MPNSSAPVWWRWFDRFRSDTPYVIRHQLARIVAVLRAHRMVPDVLAVRRWKRRRFVQQLRAGWV